MPRQLSGPPREDFDSPWKEALERFLPQALALFAPDLNERVDWRQPPVFLDKEFQDMAAGIALHGRRHVDKLVRLALMPGRYLRVLLHVEIETRRPTAAALRRATLRMQQYDYLVHDRYVLRPLLADESTPPITVYTLVVFTRGDGPGWLTAEHRALQNLQPLRYQAVYLEPWLQRWQVLQELARDNPFAVVVMAQLVAQRYRRPERLRPKVGLVRQLLDLDHPPDQVVILVKLIDWMVTLPVDMHQRYVNEVDKIQRSSRMPYVSTHERVYTRRGIEIGEAVGLRKGEEIGLKRGQHLALSVLLDDLAAQRFGILPDWARQRLQQADTDQLRTWSRRILAAESLQALFDADETPN
ncbi:hypothetical protein [Bordetella genomosp. 13]|uniref:Transposase (putative) YhgA-like domain-containing protein n=1 Tax=Bordetella genomosp. 13 TaxID=463040 RepID=A0A1W6ZAM8_9BORD|nr:hypothetical protein [Bordetella genomosp. 13]ARP93884.1 hypothetical protein CAL15_05470 [Bordetella genomosp. 13]